MKIRIYVMTHKKFEMPQSPLFRPLHVGRACGEDLGYPGDDTGENISDKNCYYSELTGLYWVWKNCHDVDYVGTCHYRRYLLGADERILMEDDYEKLLSEYDLITTKQVALNNSYYYGFCANHNKKALDAAGEVIKERYPAYYPAFERLVHGTRTYFGNMFVTSKKLYDSYCSWLFSIFAWIAAGNESETELTMTVIVNEPNEYGIYSYERSTPSEEAQGIYNSLLNYNDELEQQLQSASTQQEMNEITAQMYQNSDDSLNQIWHIVKYNSDETEFAQILEEQKSWITEKEAEAEQIRAANNGSSAEMDVNIKLNDLTEERCRELLEYLKN